MPVGFGLGVGLGVGPGDVGTGVAGGLVGVGVSQGTGVSVKDALPPCKPLSKVKKISRASPVA